MRLASRQRRRTVRRVVITGAMDLFLATTTFLPAPGVASWGTAEGDMAHAALGLAKGLRILGHRATLIAPLEPSHADAGLGLARKLSPIAFELPGHGRVERIVYDAKLPSGVELTLIGGEPLSEATSEADRARRCALFGHAVAAFARQRLGTISAGGGELEGVVAIGEGAAFTSFAIREGAKAQVTDGGPSPRLLAGLARVVIPLDPRRDLTLPEAALGAIGVSRDLWNPEGVEFYGAVSFTKAGAISADRIVTLGEGSRTALLTKGAAHRFDGVFRTREADLVSIGSGVDHAHYNPATDPHVATRFDADDTLGKARCKGTLAAELELQLDSGAPLAAVLGTGPTDAEATLLAGALGRSLRGDLVVVLASASKRGEGPGFDALDRVAKAHPGRLALHYGASEKLLHRTLGAADFLIVLDERDTVGTAVRAAMRYGTVPVARRTPATDEALVDLPASLETGSAFLFSEDDGLFGALQRAVSAHRTHGITKVVRRVMRLEGGFDRAGRRLEHLIQQIEG